MEVAAEKIDDRIKQSEDTEDKEEVDSENKVLPAKEEEAAVPAKEEQQQPQVAAKEVKAKKPKNKVMMLFSEDFKC